MTTVTLNTTTRKVEVFSSARDRQARAHGHNTKAALEAASVPAGVDLVLVRGYADAGDGGGAHYKRTASQPAHPAKIQSADGAWWELAEAAAWPEMFGADGTAANDTTAWQNLLLAAASLDLKIRPKARRYWLNAALELPNGSDFEGAPGNGTILDFTSKEDWSNTAGEGLLKCAGSLEASGRALNATVQPFQRTRIVTITRSGTTATTTTTLDHGLSSGEYVWITGATASTSADQLVFYTQNGASSRALTTPVAITVTGAKTFTYAVEDSGDTELTGIAYVENGNAIDIDETSGLSAGDLIFIRSEAERTESGSATSRVGELAYVKHVIDANVIVTRSSVRDTYLTSDTATVFKVTAKKNVRVKNFQIVGKGPNTTTPESGSDYGDRGVFFEWVDGFEISGVTFFDVDQMHTLVWGAINGTVENCTSFFDASDEAGRTSGDMDIQYGHGYGAGSQAITYRGNRVYGSRHAFIESSSSSRHGIARDIVIDANWVYGSWLGAIATHQRVDSLIITNNICRGCETGINVRYGDDTIITANVLLDCIKGVHLYNRAGKCTVSGNRIRATLYGIRVSTLFSAADLLGDLIVEDNDIEGPHRGLSIVADTAGTLVTGIHVNRNRCRDVGIEPYEIKIGDDATSADGWRGSFTHNEADNYGLRTSSRGAWLTNPKFVQVLDNRFRVGDGTASAAVYIDGDGAVSCHVDGTTNEGASEDVTIAAGLGGHFYRTTHLTRTISAGAITIDTSQSPLLIRVDTEGGAATDMLETISGGAPSQQITVVSVTNSRDITVKDGTDNIQLDGSVDFTIDHAWDTLTLVRHPTSDTWLEVSRSSQGS